MHGALTIFAKSSPASLVFVVCDLWWMACTVFSAAELLFCWSYVQDVNKETLADHYRMSKLRKKLIRVATERDKNQLCCFTMEGARAMATIGDLGNDTNADVPDVREQQVSAC